VAVKKAFFLFNLKPGLRVEDYVAWTRAVNHPEAASLKTIEEFHDYVAVRSMRGKPVAFQFVEEIRVCDFDAYIRELDDPSRPRAEGRRFSDWVDPDYVVLLAEEIE
jgi:hypothetical protein